jgi:hypothetical protein
MKLHVFATHMGMYSPRTWHVRPTHMEMYSPRTSVLLLLLSPYSLLVLSSSIRLAYGSEADICNATLHVRFTPESGHVRCN